MDDIYDNLCKLIAERSSLNYNVVPDGEKRQLYLYHLPGDDAADAAAAIKPTGGPSEITRKPTLDLAAQVFVVGPDQVQALGLAWTIYLALRDDSGLALRNVMISEGGVCRFLKIDATKPAALAVGEGGRTEASFNLTFTAAWPIEDV
jgi:hypothetical protein